MKIDWKQPELEDQELIQSYFAKYPSRSCDRTFVNVYLWAKQYHVKFAEIDDTLVFCSEHKGQLSFAWPAGEKKNVRAVLARLSDYAEALGQELRFYNITREAYQLLEEWEPFRWEIAYQRDVADYVYEREKLATLSGKKLHGKRNHINKFLRLYPNWSYEPLSEDNVEDCIRMALKWHDLNDCQGHAEKHAEVMCAVQALRLQQRLKLIGGVLRVNEEIVAFTLGEPLNDDMFVVHFEKAFTHVEGAYPMINQQFVQHVCMEFTYVNREEDTGEAGLRKAKLSYHPAMLIEKGIVTRKKESQERGL